MDRQLMNFEAEANWSCVSRVVGAMSTNRPKAPHIFEVMGCQGSS